MKNYHAWAIQIVLFLFVCSACTPRLQPDVNLKDEMVSPTPTSSPPAIDSNDLTEPESLYEENDLIDRYNDALNIIAEGTVPSSSAPTDPSETGFAIIPLDADTYGVDAFAALPISERELTDEEMLQLAYGMGGASAEQLLSPEYSWTGDGARTLYRQYTPAEHNRKNNLDTLYLYEKLRAPEPLSNDSSSGGPIYIDIPLKSSSIRFWIFPLSGMTDTQLLQIIDESGLRNLSEAEYMPHEGEMSYDEFKELALRLAVKFEFAATTPDECYAYLLAPRLRESDPRKAHWSAILIYNDGDHFSLEVDARSGSLIGWNRFPNGYFTDTSPKNASVTQVVCSDEEALDTAEDYARRVLIDYDVTTITRTIQDYTNTHFWGNVRTVRISTDSAAYLVSMTAGDLTICSVTVVD